MVPGFCVLVATVVGESVVRAHNLLVGVFSAVHCPGMSKLQEVLCVAKVTA